MITQDGTLTSAASSAFTAENAPSNASQALSQPEVRRQYQRISHTSTKPFLHLLSLTSLCACNLRYVNPLVGLAMFIVGLFLIVFGYFEYGITPVVVGLVLVAYYRKYLWQVMSMSA